MLEQMTRKLVDLLPSHLTFGQGILPPPPPDLSLRHTHTHTHTFFCPVNLILSSRLLALSLYSFRLPTFFFPQISLLLPLSSFFFH